MFWTIRAPESAVHVDLEGGTARYHMADLGLRDYGNLANAIGLPANPGRPGPSKPSTVSWDLRFSGITARQSFSDATLRFAGDYIQTGAHLDWSMTERGFSFRSNSQGQTVVASFIGRERNGVFFDRD